MKVKELIEYEEKSKIKAGEAVMNGQYPFFTSSEAEDKRYKEYTCDTEGIIMGTGGNATLHYFNGKFAVSTDCLVLKTNHRVKCKYLYYFFRANMSILQAGFKGAGLKHTNKNYIDNIQLKMLPDINEQLIIIGNLDKIDNLIQKHKKVMNYLDTLIKARFVEMFGDSPNDKFNSIKLGEVSTSKGEYGANSASIEFSDNRARYIRITDINDDGTLNNDMVASYNTTDDDKYKLEYGDIIFARTGATVGKSYYYNTKEKQIFAGYLIRFKIDIKKMIPIFVFYNTKMKYYNEWIKYSQGGVAQPNINEKKYSNLDLINAPINLQESFATFVKQVDKLKFVLFCSIISIIKRV